MGRNTAIGTMLHAVSFISVRGFVFVRMMKTSWNPFLKYRGRHQKHGESRRRRRNRFHAPRTLFQAINNVLLATKTFDETKDKMLHLLEKFVIVTILAATIVIAAAIAMIDAEVHTSLIIVASFVID